MQLVEVTYKTYSDGNRTDKTDIFITNGYRPPSSSRRRWEFRQGRKSYNESDIVTVDFLWEGLGNPPKEIVQEYADDADWESWFDTTEGGTPIEEVV